MDPYVALARSSIAAYVRERRRISPPPGLPPELASRRRGAFVSIKKGGALRGCIGTYQPTEENLAEEIIANAIRAATEDPRFPPLTPDELPEVSLSVDVLSPPEPCRAADLDPRRYGVIVEAGWRRGLLLPDLPGVDTVEEQLRIAKMKAGISADEPCRLWRFTVERHTE
ncbi:Protein TM_1551 [Candidatus Bipolaricaulis anaerobius]|uniref:Protein TM_1551 n=1 Tax=Candidatus Bipolaricaulis anaerobius TaxID=2026885 RepID=A0A2X3KV14_9BACT|nr:AmmeMemoRadiSam system protein A [Candidatus Bipolaricaulis anaerobius]SQD92468.1 Protein TM_1551 [Candidatus Bipolaricaulis anaerobius]